MEKESSEDESNQACFMVQGNDSLEITSNTQLHDYASSSGDDNAIDTHALNEELFFFCENLLSKYKALKNKSFELKEENKNLFSKFDLIFQERIGVSMKGIH